MDKLWYRAKQFFVGIFSFYTKKDDVFARNFLTIQEMALFSRLPGFEKKHSVRVAKRMLKIAHGNRELDSRQIARIGLLHDIGKVVEHNSTFTKSILVIIRFFFPSFYDWLAERGEKNIRFRRFYIHKHHGRVGAELLSKLGTPADILSIINTHDPLIAPISEDDPIELKILQAADTY